MESHSDPGCEFKRPKILSEISSPENKLSYELHPICGMILHKCGHNYAVPGITAGNLSLWLGIQLQQEFCALFMVQREIGPDLCRSLILRKDIRRNGNQNDKCQTPTENP